MWHYMPDGVAFQHDCDGSMHGMPTGSQNGMVAKLNSDESSGITLPVSAGNDLKIWAQNNFNVSMNFLATEMHAPMDQPHQSRLVPAAWGLSGARWHGAISAWACVNDLEVEVSPSLAQPAPNTCFGTMPSLTRDSVHPAVAIVSASDRAAANSAAVTTTSCPPPHQQCSDQQRRHSVQSQEAQWRCAAAAAAAAAAALERRGQGVSVEQLRQCFHLPITEAALRLEICVTALKKTCRQHGIRRWPHRQILAREKAIEKLQEASSRPDLSVAERTQFDIQLQGMRNNLVAIIQGPITLPCIDF
eukprot:TRINITY_DN610_c0_g1_i6.p1 TRINITY_DN610_c0_g1~~TRINITY_DN610_c0_g1_i6.p1  ORF type:complete len:303 (+),score=59.11 TRINITY_DN610_c0_g1_i6:278-1186(+)